MFANGVNTTITRTVTAGNPFTIDCSVTQSYPPNPTIKLKIGSQEPIDITNPIYTVNSATQSETYQCIANNTRITATLTYDIQVLQEPSESN